MSQIIHNPPTEERNMTTQKRTARGHIVGSYKPPLSEWTYWPEQNWQTHQPGFITVAPSGARFDWYADEADAIAAVKRENA